MVTADRIDSTLLRPDATEAEIISHCREAGELGCAAAVVLSAHAELAAQVLDGSHTAPCSTVAFPTGGVSLGPLLEEVHTALEAGAVELDMSLPLGMVVEGRHGELVERIHQVADLVHGSGGILKTIIEVALFDPPVVGRICTICADGGADLVKSSSGFFGNPTPEMVALMRQATPAHVGIKAAGGLRTPEDAKAMLQSGADRIGTSTVHSVLGKPGPF